MKFFSSAALGIQVVSMLALAGVGHAGACDANSDFFLGVNLFGKSSSGSAFCMAHWQTGGMVNSLQVFYNSLEGWIVGVKVGYTDGKTESTGKITSSSTVTTKTMSWDALSDPIAEAYVDQGWILKRIESISFKTKSGKVLTAGKSSTLGTGSQVDSGNGLLFGVQGFSSDTVYGLGLMFGASALSNIDVTNLKFDKTIEELTQAQTGVQTVNLDENYYSNKGDASMTFNFGSSAQQAVQRAYHQGTTNSLTTGVTVSFDVGVPLVEKISLGASAAYGYTTVTDTTTAYTTMQTESWAMTGTVPASSAIHCSAVAESGTLSNIGYTSTVTVTFQNGKSITYQETGTFTGISWTSAFASCSGLPLASVPITAHKKRMAATDTLTATIPAETALPEQRRRLIPRPKKFGGLAMRAALGETPEIPISFSA